MTLENEKLRRLCDELHKQLAREQKSVNELGEDNIKLRDEISELKSIKFARFANEECWIYQGDGEDHLESLVCPVVISAEKLIELEAEVKRLRDLIREAAPLEWVFNLGDDEAEAWEKKAEKLLEDTDGRP